ncbi:ABC transporter substrate-binding protein [Pelosinus propionicus]|uniref:Iron complex transport system substrate-binding protein n=1 Tax=Pelosinus propionicus DSM 13327 TaxID=1123291 RepID=A0A1I4P4H9_9FIRM|nr:ABC transporter substrate-binding protein [Pelosinus propionicus]SFM22678.1 iron complex transport system substrate-binding protein [Pelosinus propionicus DSM 13327]
MKKLTLNPIILILCFIGILSLAGCGQSTPAAPTKAASPPSQNNDAKYPITISNYDSNENPTSYTYKKAPQRVAIVHPGATELLLELGLEDRILSTIPPYGAPLERIADRYSKLKIMKAKYLPSQEELLEMQPDMIIGWAHNFRSSELGDVKSWQERGAGTFVMQSTLTKIEPTLDTVVYSFIADMGTIFGIQEKTTLYIQNLKDRVAKVQAATKDIPQRKTVIVLQDHFNGTFSVYDSHYLISSMIDLAGGKNLCQGITSFVGAEKVLAYDPDFIIYVSHDRNEDAKDLTDEEALKALHEISALQSMRAIQKGNIINLPFFTVNNGGIRTVDAIEKIFHALYPEQYQ